MFWWQSARYRTDEGWYGRWMGVAAHPVISRYVLSIRSLFPVEPGGGEGPRPNKSLPWCTWSWPAAHIPWALLCGAQPELHWGRLMIPPQWGLRPPNKLRLPPNRGPPTIEGAG